MIESYLNNDTLVIPANVSKLRREERILLNPEDVPVAYRLHKRYDTWRNTVKVPKPKYFKDKYTKEFKRICRIVGLDDNKLHDLRHTFAVRRYLITRDIYQVMRDMRHAKISMTQRYAKFENTIDIKKEFPSIIGGSNKPIFGKWDTVTRDTNPVYWS